MLGNEIFSAIGENLSKTKTTFIAPLNLSIIYLSLIKNMTQEQFQNKSACSESNPVQSSRSKLTCPREGRLLSFLSNSTVTSDDGAQNLGNDVWHDSQLFATKVCSQILRK